MIISTKLYLDTRNKKNTDLFPLSVVFTCNGKSAIMPLGIKIRTEQWNKKSQCIINHTQSTMLNKVIFDKLYLIQLELHKIQENSDVDYLSIVDIKNHILKKIQGKQSSDPYDFFKKCYDEFTNLKDGRTKELYETTWRRISDYDDKCDIRKMSDIDVKWIVGFNDFLKKTAPSANSRAIHLRHIRAVFNFAINEELTSSYPFRQYKIEIVETKKRNLPAHEIRLMKEMEVLKWQELHRDIFMLSFYLIGINIKDLFALTNESIVNGRIEYTRAKTHKNYSIKIEPEAMEIINKYRGKDKLLNVAERYKNVNDFTHNHCEALKTLGTWEKENRKIKYHPFWKHLSSYWARHSWATIAADIDIPIDTISAALGHANGTKVTLTYVAFNQKKVDEANRKVIDHVLKAEKK